jgi:hypothetical protein
MACIDMLQHRFRMSATVDVQPDRRAWKHPMPLLVAGREQLPQPDVVVSSVCCCDWVSLGSFNSASQDHSSNSSSMFNVGACTPPLTGIGSDLCVALLSPPL